MGRMRSGDRSSATSFLQASRERVSWPWIRTTIAHNRPRSDELLHPVGLARAASLHARLRHDGYTMLSSRRGRTLHRLGADLDRRSVPGAIVDCGVWNGGSSIILSLAAPGREIYALDSFEGLPQPTAEDGPDSVGWAGEYSGAEAKVRGGFTRFADPERLHVRPGWFEDTLPGVLAEVDGIALLHVDADWYESVRVVLETLYPRLAPGGFVVIDDYMSWVGAQKATDDFRAAHGISAPMVDGHYWKVPV